MTRARRGIFGGDLEKRVQKKGVGRGHFDLHEKGGAKNFKVDGRQGEPGILRYNGILYGKNERPNTSRERGLPKSTKCFLTWQLGGSGNSSRSDQRHDAKEGRKGITTKRKAEVGGWGNRKTTTSPQAGAGEDRALQRDTKCFWKEDKKSSATT